MPKFGHLLYLLTIVYRGMFPHRDIMSYTWRMIILLFFGTPIISWTHIFLQTQNLQKAPIFVAACITALLIFVSTNEDVESKSMNAMHANSGMLTTLLWQCPVPHVKLAVPPWVVVPGSCSGWAWGVRMHQTGKWPTGRVETGEIIQVEG